MSASKTNKPNDSFKEIVNSIDEDDSQIAEKFSDTDKAYVKDIIVSAYTSDKLLVSEATLSKTTAFLLRIVRAIAIREGITEETFLQQHRNFFLTQDKGKKSPAAMYSNRNSYNRLLTRTDSDADNITYTNAERILQDIFGIQLQSLTFNYYSPRFGKKISVSSDQTFSDVYSAYLKDKALEGGIDKESLEKAS